MPSRKTGVRVTRAQAAFAFLGLVALALAACLPQPDDPVEYLRQPDSVVVQMLVIEPGQSEFAQLLEVPAFTLYGDGTVIYASAEDPSVLLQSQLPEDAVRGLLEAIVDEDFLNFRYEQVGEAFHEGRAATYVYAHTLDAANAVRAFALDTELTDEHGSEWDEFRALQQIVARLQEVDPAALGGSAPEPFVPERAVQYRRVGMRGAFDAVSVGGDGARVLLEQAVDGGEVFEADGQTVELGYRPMLPYEENFPEFDLP